MSTSSLAALAGGFCIGAAVLLMLALLGRLAGVSGIVANFLADRGNRFWPGMFLGGLLCGAWLYHLLSGIPYPQASDLNPGWAVAAGLLVGFGTRLGSGCTSGHGVCGISRGSRRSIVETLVFLSSGFVTVYLTRHILGLGG